MDGLIFNAEKHQYFLNGNPLPSVTQILSNLGFIDKNFFTEYGRTRGKFVHLACELDDKNDLDEESLDSALLPYLKAWRSFKRDTGIKIEKIEEPNYSLIYSFAGTPDRVCVQNRTKTIIDIKSGTISAVTGLQLAAYDILEGGTRSKRFAVQLMETGKYKLHTYADPQDRQIFISAVACWHWINNQKKGE